MKGILKHLIYYIVTLSLLSSCITTKDTNLMQDIKKDYSTVPPAEEYRIIPGDVLNIVVYIFDDPETEKLFQGLTPRLIDTKEGNLYTGLLWHGDQGATNEGTESTTPISVYADGTINFPYIGRIFVQDLTLLEARKLITSRLQEISTNASANVTLRNSYFSILGESGARRVNMTSNNMTIYQALATSNKISDYSARNKVNIIRQTKDGSIVKTFDLRTKDIINTEFYYIQPNDVIYFPQKQTKFFGATSTFTGIFALATSFIAIIVGAFKLF